jgi:CheY-like chemotaxis protein
MSDLSEPGARWVVLVEDDLAVAQMYRLGLELQGFKVTIATSGNDLFGSLNGQAPDVIVLDYQLPQHNGAQVLERIRRDDRIGTVRVFMLSNFPPTHENAIDRVFRAGAIAWLEKSKTPPRLLAEKLVEALQPARAEEAV